MAKSKTVPEPLVSECENTAKFLGWETGAVRSLDHALEMCDEVDVCRLNCKCRLREAYHFYRDETGKEYR